MKGASVSCRNVLKVDLKACSTESKHWEENGSLGGGQLGKEGEGELLGYMSEQAC